ncbi:glycosyl hydrolase [Fusarium oxysporum]|nr:glycosyl hydrolase [Fusarium oxysporum]
MPNLSILLTFAWWITCCSSSEPRLRLAAYVNPILPGWHSDPSCVHVKESFFCVTSTFMTFPGLPVYTSRDLVTWNLASHVWNRESQLPGLSWRTPGQTNGMYAATIRHHEGVYYVVCAYLGLSDKPMGVLFNTTNPLRSSQWSDPIILDLSEIDPDLFWDDDGKTYLTTAGITLQEINLETGQLGEASNIWNGTSNEWPEGPHIYKKDGWYYLVIAEGGTSQKHAVSISRSKEIKGPYMAYERNPILTNRDTTEYFQSVGHADLFQDSNGNWWGLCLAIRSGPSYEYMPMGREAVLFKVTWNTEEWPKLEPIRGRMPPAPLPRLGSPASNKGPNVSGNDRFDFTKVTKIPSSFVHHRVPPQNAFLLSNRGLKVRPSRANLTGDSLSTEAELTGQNGLSLVGRRQSHTLFNFSIDIDFWPRLIGQESGLTVFRTQLEHIDLSLVRVPTTRAINSFSNVVFRLSGVSPSRNITTHLTPVPKGWEKTTIRLEVSSPDDSKYVFTARSMAALGPRVVIGTVTTSAVSGRGGSGFFVGSILGAFSSCNGAGFGKECPQGGDLLIKTWVYTGVGQKISSVEIIPMSGPTSY